ncbi:MAG: S41 family peptidase [Sphingopyxis sp.]|uniref:S41 family peptidase n=1 Tax=Sphingopyxis sp. TaxID=1908224 RepID=UPI003D6D277F
MTYRNRLLIGLAAMALGAASAADATTGEARLMRYPDISGQRIGFIYADRLWVADANGDNARPIAVPGSELNRVRFSPDGQWIALTAKVDGNADVYIVPTDGSSAARRLTHHPAADLVVDWRPDGKAVLFASTMSSPRATYDQLHTIDVAGGLPQRLPLPYGETATYTSDGKALLFTYQRDFQEEAWKRYYGGRAPDIWRFEFVTGATRKLTDHPSSDSMPMQIAGRTYFLSERDATGRSNIWRLGEQGATDDAITTYGDTDVRRPATDGSRIIFEVGGSLAIFDPATGGTSAVTVRIDPAAVAKAPENMAVGDRITSAALSPDGVTIEARGDIFTYAANGRSVRNISATSGFAERFPRANTRGDIAYVSDADGEYALYVKAAGNAAPRKVADFGPGFRYAPFWSPDGARIAIYDQEQVLWIVDVASGARTRVDQGKWGYHPEMVEATVSWSPDSRWLAYTRGLDNRNNALFLFDTHSGDRHQLTSGAFDDFAPMFEASGNYLLMLSRRRFVPTFGDNGFDATWTYTNGTVATVLPLRAHMPAPGDPGWTMPARQAVVAVDLADAEQRLKLMPPKPGLLAAIRPVDGGYVLIRQGDGDGDSQLERYDYGKEAPRVLQSGNGLALADANADQILTRIDTELYRVDAAKGKPAKIDGRRLVATVDHAAEAQQMFNDAWRYGRDFYYDPGLHGIDWNVVRARLAPLVPYVTNDDDLTFIVREMMGELNGGHVYASATAPRPRGDATNVGLLGADFTVDNGRYRVAKIYRTGARAYEVRSPLDDDALDVREGDELLAVNGKPLSGGTGPWEALTGLAGKEVALTIARGDATEREVRVKTLTSERKLRELAWVEENRRKVDAASAGRIGYIYVPNTGAEGQNELMIQYRSQFDKDALIIDERFNTGGALGDRMVELLNRPPLVYFRARNSTDYPLPELAHRGPKAMLTNGWSYSGGDGFPLLFKTAEVGPLIGTRTWGGLIGPGLSLPLINGGFISPAPQRVYTTGGEWAEGNEGVKPDIEIDNDPGLLAQGIDQQLDTAVRLLRDRIAGMKPVTTPAFQGAGDWNPALRKEK